MHGQAHQHMHLRQRAHRTNSVRYAYPSSNTFVRVVDAIIYVISIIGPFVSIPQLVEIYGKGNTAGVSLPTWIGYTVLTAIWLVYGTVHHERPIIIAQSLWLVFNALVVVGVIIH